MGDGDAAPLEVDNLPLGQPVNFLFAGKLADQHRVAGVNQRFHASRQHHGGVNRKHPHHKPRKHHADRKGREKAQSSALPPGQVPPLLGAEAVCRHQRQQQRHAHAHRPLRKPRQAWQKWEAPLKNNGNGRVDDSRARAAIKYQHTEKNPLCQRGGDALGDVGNRVLRAAQAQQAGIAQIRQKQKQGDSRKGRLSVFARPPHRTEAVRPHQLPHRKRQQHPQQVYQKALGRPVIRRGRQRPHKHPDEVQRGEIGPRPQKGIGQRPRSDGSASRNPDARGKAPQHRGQSAPQRPGNGQGQPAGEHHQRDGAHQQTARIPLISLCLPHLFISSVFRLRQSEAPSWAPPSVPEAGAGSPEASAPAPTAAPPVRSAGESADAFSSEPTGESG
ncbi:hypothetical protein SDC9_88671 [bioreactor metagenome]|uniref:Uncharacterized protein n=1 Tax=bioreactor metagenome TaxID=1076179 RepID=A0A644ZM52_9ZZZZ